MVPKKTEKPPQEIPEASAPGFDDVLKRMLATAPDPKVKDIETTPKPAVKSRVKRA